MESAMSWCQGRIMADEESFGWVFDSLVGFLKGPVWEAAVLTFIEQKSVVFDPVEGDESEYKKLHEEYKNLVDTMLSSHMQDLGITPEQFEQACDETEKSIHSQFRKSLFEQIWAADNFEIFKRMMLQKNLELQLQAIDLLAHQYGMLPESFLPSDDYEPSKEEKSIMEAVVKRYEEEVGETGVAPECDEIIQETKVKLVAEREKEKKLLEQAMEKTLHSSEKTDAEETPITFSKPIEVSPEEAKRRQEYLRQQRDRLLALKRQEREKQLRNLENSSNGSSRPRSARAAQRAIREETDEQLTSELDPKMLAFRKSLAARLKAEVVDKQ